MTYIDAERLKAEIRHLKIDVYDEANQFDIGARSSLTFLESFIDSLQQEMWKPSKEQMRALNEIVNILAESPFLHQNDYLFNILNGLREELKKLL